ncbi:MAG: ABC transporter substrate-binding protein [Anaerolineaceae bacterium]|nr:MAG: ABC transporter substrate-binding protein [Anaerolineaceae bacterium]
MRKLLFFSLMIALMATSAMLVSAQDDEGFDCGTDEEVTISFFGDPVGSHPQAEADTIARFQELCPNITVERNPGAADVTDLLAFYLVGFEAQSSDLDVIRVDVIWPGQLAEHLIDLSDIAPQAHVDAQLPALIENNTIDERLVALPLRIGFGMLYYRSDLLEKYGFEAPPATWEELEEMALVIQEGERAEGNSEFWGYVWQGNAYEGLTTNALEWHVSETGDNFLTPDGEILINSEAAINAYERAASWVGTISPPGVVSYAEEDARGVWHAGNAAFMRNWPYAYVTSAESEDIPAFDVAPLPAGASGIGASTLGGWHVAVSRYSDHPEAAAAFVVYMTSVENQKFYAIDTSSPPAALELYDDEDIQTAMPFASPDIVEITTARPSNFARDQYNAVSTLYFSAIHDILTGREDADTALELLELDLLDLFGE